MCGVLAVLFIAVPAVELWVLLRVGALIGAGPTLLIIAATAIFGAALAKRQGLSAIRQLQASLAEGRQVGNSMVEAALVLVAGVLMMTPGFITDAIGLALLIPPVRALAGRGIVRRLAAGMSTRVVIGGIGRPPQGRAGAPEDRSPPPKDVIDV